MELILPDLNLYGLVQTQHLGIEVLSGCKTVMLCSVQLWQVHQKRCWGREYWQPRKHKHSVHIKEKANGCSSLFWVPIQHFHFGNWIISYKLLELREQIETSVQRHTGDFQNAKWSLYLIYMTYSIFVQLYFCLLNNCLQKHWWSSAKLLMLGSNDPSFSRHPQFFPPLIFIFLLKRMFPHVVWKLQKLYKSKTSLITFQAP